MKNYIFQIFRLREANIFIALVILCISISIANSTFYSGDNIKLLVREIALFGVMAIGETFVIISGGIDLSPGSMVALTGVLVALFMKKIGMAGGIFSVLLVAGGIGIIHGIFVTKLRVPPFIITLGTLCIARAVAAIITKGYPITGLPSSFAFLEQGEIIGIPVPFFIFVSIAIISIFIMKYTTLGRHIYAIGGNIEAAKLSGIDVDKKRIFCYLVSAVLAGVSGILVASRLDQGQAGVGGAYELIAIAAAVIGGISLTGGEGTMIGPILGTAIMSVLRDGLVLLEVSTYWHDVVIGGVVVVAVTLDMLRKRKR